MKDLIEALTIFAKYANRRSPTHCEHDTLCVVGISEDAVSAEDKARLAKLGFSWSLEFDSWCSFRFGSA